MKNRKEHTQITKQLQELLEQDAKLKALVEKSIRLAAEENPDEVKNPVRSLEMLYDYIDFTQTVMPWAYLPEECFKNFVTKTDQSCLYIYYLLDRPLPELEQQLPFRPSVQFLKPIYHWLKDYNNALKVYMDSEDGTEGGEVYIGDDKEDDSSYDLDVSKVFDAFEKWKQLPQVRKRTIIRDDVVEIKYYLCNR